MSSDPAPPNPPERAFSAADLSRIVKQVQGYIAADYGQVPETAPALTLEEYLDPERFPATTLKAVGHFDQMRADARLYQQLHAELVSGERFTKLKRELLVELMTKVPNIPRLWKSLVPTAQG